MRPGLKAPGRVTLVAIALAASFLSGAQPVAAATTSCTTVPPADPDRVWPIAARHLADLAGPSTLPFGATGSGPYLRTSAYAWTSGFYPASLWLMYARTADRTWLARARAYTARVLPVARWSGTHDLGFMVGLPAGIGARLDPSPARREEYRAAMVTAAGSLSRRWNASVGAIHSADYSGHWGLIIDSAMNAPLLIEAGQMAGGARGAELSRRGVQHLLTLARDLVRADGSTVHRMAYDTGTGRPIGPVPGQGLGPTSTWARGQAWAVNGFTQGYSLTRDDRLLEAARRTADYWLAHVPGGCIPAWDLDVSAASAPRDSSAAAIAADGLQALAGLDPDPQRAERYRSAAQATLGALSSPALVPERGRGVLQHQSWNVPAIAREGTYSWGDAYLLEGLLGSTSA